MFCFNENTGTNNFVCAHILAEGVLASQLSSMRESQFDEMWRLGHVAILQTLRFTFNKFFPKLLEIRGSKSSLTLCPHSKRRRACI
jgi:hypothetical protein